MFAPKPKKPAVGVTIAFGKPKAGPPALDTPGKKPGMGMMGADKPAVAAADPAEDPVHEAAETPDYESQEDAGAQMTSQIDSIFEDAGIDKEQGRQIASKLFSAVAKCLGGDTGAMDGADSEGADDTADYPA